MYTPGSTSQLLVVEWYGRQDYRTCPRRYAYSTIYDFQRHEGSFLPFWQATRATLKTLIERINAESLQLSQEQLVEIFNEHPGRGLKITREFDRI